MSQHAQAYKDTLRYLLSGRVICAWSSPESMQVLESEENRRRINTWVSELDMKLAQTSGGAGYYLVYEGVSSHTRDVARELFRSIMKELRFHVEMLETFMKVLHPDTSLVPGETIHLAQLLQAADESPDICGMLADLPTSRNSRVVKEQAEALLARLKREEIVVETNPKRSIFTFTAKIDLIQDILIFIQESEGIPVTEPDSPDQGALL